MNGSMEEQAWQPIDTVQEIRLWRRMSFERRGLFIAARRQEPQGNNFQKHGNLQRRRIASPYAEQHARRA